MFFKKSDLEAMVANGAAEQEKLAALQRKLRDLRPKWIAAQAACELIQAQIDCIDSTYRRDVSELFWAERREEQQSAVDAACSRRDLLTAALCKEIQELKQRVFIRNVSLTGDFSSWVSETVKKLGENHPLAESLTAARVRCEASTDIREIVEQITRAVEDVAAQPQACVALFNLSNLAKRLSEVPAA